jgi:hypothetical protein
MRPFLLRKGLAQRRPILTQFGIYRGCLDFLQSEMRDVDHSSATKLQCDVAALLNQNPAIRRITIRRNGLSADSLSMGSGGYENAGTPGSLDVAFERS